MVGHVVHFTPALLLLLWLLFGTTVVYEFYTNNDKCKYLERALGINHTAWNPKGKTHTTQEGKTPHDNSQKGRKKKRVHTATTLLLRQTPLEKA